MTTQGTFKKMDFLSLQLLKAVQLPQSSTLGDINPPLPKSHREAKHCANLSPQNPKQVLSLQLYSLPTPTYEKEEEVDYLKLGGSYFDG